MTYSSESKSPSPLNEDQARTKRAEALVNPASGLANDYLNIFNEIVMLIETLPAMPDLFEDILRWHPTSYRDYFRRSILPGRGSAIETYDRLDARFRRDFEALVADLDRRSTGAVAAVRRQFKANPDDHDALAAVCERGGASIRESLEKAVSLVNYGEAGEIEDVQDRTDRIMAKLARLAG
jgi:hypothetical protein